MATVSLIEKCLGQELLKWLGYPKIKIFIVTKFQNDYGILKTPTAYKGLLRVYQAVKIFISPE